MCRHQNGAAGLLFLARTEAGARVELEEDYVAVLHNIVLALLPVASGGLDAGLAALLLEVRELHHLSHDEALLEVCMNPTGSLWCLGVLEDGPSFHLVRSSREEIAELQGLVTLNNDLVQS